MTLTKLMKNRFNVFFFVFFRPVRFEVEESKEYWICNCKQTKNRPFCDGTHKSKEVQDASSIIRQ